MKSECDKTEDKIRFITLIIIGDLDVENDVSTRERKIMRYTFIEA